MKCVICGNEHNNKKYCSTKCQYEGYKEKKTERIIKQCLYCGKEFETLITKNKKYCSRGCVDKHKKIIYLGENNPMYNFKITEETRKKHSDATKKMWKDENISNKIKEGVKKYNDTHENPFGWSDEAREKRINTYIKRYGIDNNMKDEKVREMCDKTCIERYGMRAYEIMIDALHKTKITKIEKIFEHFLIENNIKYKKQYRIYFKNENGKLKFRSYDFYLINENVLVETDGDYWHGNPNFFKKLNETQIKNVKNDIFKNELAKNKNIKLIRIWENEILNDNFEDKIKEIICLKK